MCDGRGLLWCVSAGSPEHSSWTCESGPCSGLDYSHTKLLACLVLAWSIPGEDACDECELL